MGYNTTFEGCFEIDHKLDDETYMLLGGLGTTRRMKRDMKKVFPDMSDAEIEERYGVDGEFYVGGGYNDIGVKNPNIPPKNQPSIYCQWLPRHTEDGKTVIEWDGVEKAHKMPEWIEYIIDYILAPRNYVVNGEVFAEGEDGEHYKIVVSSNKVSVKMGRIVYDD